MTPLAVFAISIAAAIAVGTLRSLELARPLATPLAPGAAPRVAPLPAPARSAAPAHPSTPVGHSEAA